MKRLVSIFLVLFMLLSTYPAFADSSADMVEKGDSYALMQDYDHATACYRLAQMLDPTNADAYIKEAELYLTLDNLENAEKAIITAINANPISKEAWRVKCQIDIMGADISAFEEDVLFAEVCDADLSCDYTSVAMMYADAGIYEKAAFYFENTKTESLDDAQREIFRRTLILSGQREKAENLGLVASSEHDQILDQAFQDNNLQLVRKEWPPFTLDQFEFSHEMLTAAGVTEDYLNSEEIQASFAQSNIEIVSLSPTGNSGLVSIDDTGAASYYNGKYHVLFPSANRGVEDIDENLKRYYSYLSFVRMIGEEGVVYSRDGRYAAALRNSIVVQNAQFYLDPILIDLSSGEIILTQTYGNRIMQPGAGAVITSCFSADNKYFYYVLIGSTTDDRFALYRYDLSGGKTELCCSIPYRTYYPNLYETADGSFILVDDTTNVSENTSIITIKMQNGEWEVSRNQFSLPSRYWHVTKQLYSANSGYSLYSGRTGNDIVALFMVVKPDEEFVGLNQYYAIERENNQVVAVDVNNIEELLIQAVDKETSKISMAAFPYYAIQKVLLSPDGFYALFLTRNGQDDARLFIVGLDTLDVREVSGIDPLTIPVAAMAKYSPIIEWNSNTLVIGTENGIEMFEFE